MITMDTPADGKETGGMAEDEARMYPDPGKNLLPAIRPPAGSCNAHS
jgi:hypothetical protein